MNKLLGIIISLLLCLPVFSVVVEDEFATLLPVNQQKLDVYKNYNFESTEKIPINLKIIEPIKKETEVYEGQILNFKVSKDVLYSGKILLKRGTPAQAKVSIIITPGMNGIPASIIFNDFKIEGLTQGRISREYEISGQDRSWLVFPLKWALTALPPSGSLTNFIMGGHAKINYKKQMTIYYYPDWK
jgi:hypothetical protein